MLLLHIAKSKYAHADTLPMSRDRTSSVSAKRGQLVAVSVRGNYLTTNGKIFPLPSLRKYGTFTYPWMGR
jgi:hypothetical protein